MTLSNKLYDLLENEKINSLWIESKQGVNIKNATIEFSIDKKFMSIGESAGHTLNAIVAHLENLLNYRVREFNLNNIELVEQDIFLINLTFRYSDKQTPIASNSVAVELPKNLIGIDLGSTEGDRTEVVTITDADYPAPPEHEPDAGLGQIRKEFKLPRY